MLFRLCLGVIVTAIGGAAAIAGYPDRPIRIVVPLPKGGSTDAVTGAVAPKVAVDLDQKSRN